MPRQVKSIVSFESSDRFRTLESFPRARRKWPARPTYQVANSFVFRDCGKRIALKTLESTTGLGSSPKWQVPEGNFRRDATGLSATTGELAASYTAKLYPRLAWFPLEFQHKSAQ
jgi:hypothetical protein